MSWRLWAATKARLATSSLTQAVKFQPGQTEYRATSKQQNLKQPLNQVGEVRSSGLKLHQISSRLHGQSAPAHPPRIASDPTRVWTPQRNVREYEFSDPTQKSASKLALQSV